MTDLSGILDQRMNDRIVSALNELDFVEFQTLMSNLLGKIGLTLTDRKTEGDAVQFRGESEEGRYLILASRLFDHASLSSVKRLRTLAKAEGRNPVLMITNDLEPEAKRYAETEAVSFADKQKLLLLLRKYELADPIVEKLDQRILESQGSRGLPSAGRFDKHMDNAIELMDAGHYDEALFELDRALELKPNHDDVWRMRASALYHLGHLDEATESCQKAIELRPTDHNAWLLLGLIRGEAGDLEGELRSYDNALRLDPGNRSALLNRGTALYRAKKLDQALKSFDQLINANNEDAMAWNNRGIVLKTMGRRRDAMDAFSRAAALDRDYANPLINLGIMHTEDAQPEKAAQDWKMVLQLQRRRPEIWFSLGEALSAVGELDDARVAYESALQYDPTMEEAKRRIEEIDLALNPPPEEAPPEAEPINECSAPLAPKTLVVEAMAVERAITPSPAADDGQDVAGESAPVVEQCHAEPQLEEKVEVVDDAPVPLERSLVREPDMSLEMPPKERLEIVAEPERAMVEIKEGPVHDDAQELGLRPEAIPIVASSKEGEEPASEEAQRCEPVPDMEVAPPPVVCETLDMVAATLAAIMVEAEPMSDPKVEEDRTDARTLETEQMIDLPTRRRLAAKMLLMVGEADRALVEVDRALQEEPESPELMVLRSEVLIALGRQDEALTSLGASYQIDRDPEVIYDIEALSYRFGLKAESHRLLGMLPSSQEAFARELAGHLERREFEQVLTKSSQAGDRSSALSKQCLALALMERRRYREASKVWQELLTQFPGWAEALNNLGVCMRFMGEHGYEEPLRYMMLATLIDQDFAEAWNNIGCVYFAAGAYDEALKAFRSAIAIDRNPDYYLNLSSAQMAIGELAGAKQSLTSALQLEETPEVLFMLAVIAEKEGDLRWAASLYADAIALKPDFRDAMFNLQRVKLQLKYSK
jgi:tetratricopeptide (TPR) repeat protein